MDPSQLNKLAEAAYGAYFTSRGGKAFNGDPLPEWPAVREDLKAAWLEAVLAVLIKYTNIITHEVIKGAIELNKQPTPKTPE